MKQHFWATGIKSRTFILLITLITFNSKGQQIYEDNDLLRGNDTNPYASSVGASGVPPIGMPLFKEFPISLSYDASGFRPDQLPTEMGLGWSLVTGGEITRVVHGLRDEQATASFDHYNQLTQQEKADWNTGTATVGRSANLQAAVEAYANQQRDLAPDEFNYTVQGRRGKFIFTYDAANPFVPKVLSDHKIKVTMNMAAGSYKFSRVANSYQGYISSITIVFEDGVSCEFGQPEISTDDVAPMPNGSRFSDPITSMNTWKVTQITTPGQQSPVYFYYADYGNSVTKHYSNETDAQSLTRLSPSKRILTSTSGTSTLHKQYISAIFGPYYYFVFYYRDNTSTIWSSNSIKVLSSLALYSSSSYNLMSKYNFSYQRVSKDRVLLTKFEKLGITQGSIKSAGIHKFEYNMVSSIPDYDYFSMDDFQTLLGIAQNPTSPTSINATNTAPPLTNTAVVDWWGYYAGVTTPYNTLIQSWSSGNQVPPSLKLTSISGTAAEREPNASATQALILQKIIFPTGGYSQYTLISTLLWRKVIIVEIKERFH